MLTVADQLINSSPFTGSRKLITVFVRVWTPETILNKMTPSQSFFTSAKGSLLWFFTQFSDQSFLPISDICPVCYISLSAYPPQIDQFNNFVGKYKLQSSSLYDFSTNSSYFLLLMGVGLGHSHEGYIQIQDVREIEYRWKYLVVRRLRLRFV
jgi:hypothetical protein